MGEASRCWIWLQDTGELLTPTGAIAGKGFSGREAGRNNPALQSSHLNGPIPQGDYLMEEVSGSLGYFGADAIPLRPLENAPVFGRGGFVIHGDEDEAMFHTQGQHHCCVVLPFKLREKLTQSPIRVFRVVENRKFI